MSDLFEKINKGSILLWNVEDEKELPKRKETIRLLGTEEFTYYKSHGHHREHVKTLARLKSCLDNSIPEKHRGFWSYIPTSHFLFTEKEIE